MHLPFKAKNLTKTTIIVLILSITLNMLFLAATGTFNIENIFQKPDESAKVPLIIPQTTVKKIPNPVSTITEVTSTQKTTTTQATTTTKRTTTTQRTTTTKPTTTSTTTTSIPTTTTTTGSWKDGLPRSLR